MINLDNLMRKLRPVFGIILVGGVIVALLGDHFIVRKIFGPILGRIPREVLESRNYLATEREGVFAFKGKWRNLKRSTEFNQFNEIYSLSRSYGDLWIGPAVKSRNPEFFDKVINNLDTSKYFYLIYTVVFDENVFYAIEGFTHGRMDRVPVENVISYNELDFFGADFRVLVHFPEFRKD